MILKGLEIGSIGVNCYIIGCEETKEAAVIDPGGNPRAIKKLLDENGLTAIYIINTHGHIDHIGGNRELKELTGAKIMIHQKDAKMLTNAVANFSFLMGSKVTSPAADEFIKEGDTIKVGNTVELEVIEVPGHSPGSVALKVDNIIFAGDALFYGSIGRTDFPGGNHADLLDAIHRKLLPLGDDVQFISGHGPMSTFGHERANNPFLI